ncbi:MAG: Ig-like domain repeat protein, partial [Acidimicrobiales bacterium]
LGDGYPEGTIAVYNSATKLCSATVTSVSGDGASATCSLSANELAGGSYSDVFATYSPGTPSSSDASFTYGTSSSTPPQAFSVFSAPTTTGLALSSPSVVYGAEISEIFTITVTGQSGDGYPEGTVAVYNSTTKLSTATLTPVSGDSTSATCSLSADELAGGDYSDVFATYSPGTPSSSNASYIYGTSSSTPAQAFSVSSVSSTHTTVSESPTGVAYGHESASLFSVTVTTHYGQAVPNDQKVTVNVGPVDCVALLKDGEGTCTIARTALQAGSYPVSAIYGGDATLSGSSGAGASRLSVRKDTTRITVSESPTNVTYGQESASVFSVTVTTRYGEAVPDGEKVRVAIGSVTRTVVLKNGNGTCTMTNNALQPGSYPVLASYGGDPNLSGSRVSELTVRKDTTRTTVSESPTNVTYGHESASVFSVKVTMHHGEAVPKGEKATVHVGDVSCTVVLKGGSGTCTIANRALPVGSYPVSATYGGDPDLRSSRGSSASRLTV